VTFSAHGSPRDLKACVLLFDEIDDSEQVEGRARQPVELGHDEDVAGLQLVQHAFQFRPPGGHARNLLTVNPLNIGFRIKPMTQHALASAAASALEYRDLQQIEPAVHSALTKSPTTIPSNIQRRKRWRSAPP
jgi:hypothetical protein